MTGGVLLLAAGAARRFGSDKRLYAIDDGRPLLLASLDRYARAFGSVIVVLRSGDAAAAGVVAGYAGPGRVRVVHCPDAHLGMGHSLACGARQIPGHWAHVFIALADMAWVRPATLTLLRDAMAGAAADAVVQPQYQGQPGHPVGFGARHIPSLTTLQGDEGARGLIHDIGVTRIEVDDPGVLQDLDRPPQ
ncbi:MAG: nucleotidyltransferase family protein [Gammaproteobacteria bacterium]|nr:nucleotidyltransferase family protein [Gammaproteobacteria bacterium]